MNMRASRWVKAGLVLALAGCLTAASIAQSAGEVAGAGAAPFPAGTTFNLIPVRGMQFGMGAGVTAGSLDTGDLYVTLLGTSLLGEPQVITLDGAVTGISILQGTAVLNGTGTLDMGDGVSTDGVPFTATATGNTLLLVLGGATLPKASLTQGAITIK